MVNNRHTVLMLIVVALVILILVGIMGYILSNFHSQKLFQYVDETNYDKLEQTCKNPFINVNAFSKNLGWVDVIFEKSAPMTVLQYACKKNDTQAVAILLKHGADPNKIHSRSNSTPLSLASAHGNFEIISMLVDHGADVTSQALNGVFSALRYARYKGSMSLQDFQNLVELFEQNGFELNQTDNAGESILFQAARFSDLEVTKYLVESYEMSLFSINYDGQTLLHVVSKSALAAEYKAEYVKYLIEKGVDIHMKDSSGKTPCDYATENGFTEIAELLK